MPKKCIFGTLAGHMVKDDTPFIEYGEDERNISPNLGAYTVSEKPPDPFFCYNRLGRYESREIILENKYGTRTVQIMIPETQVDFTMYSLFTELIEHYNPQETEDLRNLKSQNAELRARLEVVTQQNKELLEITKECMFRRFETKKEPQKC